MRNPLPGYTKGIPAAINMITGEPIPIPTGWGPDLISAVFPTKSVPDISKDPVFSLLMDLGISGPFSDQTLPDQEELLRIRRPSRTVTFEGEDGFPTKAKLTPKQYNRYLQLAAGAGLDGEFVLDEEDVLPVRERAFDEKGFMRRGLYELILGQEKNGWPLAKEKWGEEREISETTKVATVDFLISLMRSEAKKQLRREFPELASEVEGMKSDKLRAMGAQEDELEEHQDSSQETLDEIRDQESAFKALESLEGEFR
jgi:hypothetical protein